MAFVFTGSIIVSLTDRMIEFIRHQATIFYSAPTLLFALHYFFKQRFLRKKSICGFGSNLEWASHIKHDPSKHSLTCLPSRSCLN
jgi:hypothetical protein